MPHFRAILLNSAANPLRQSSTLHTRNTKTTVP